MLLVIQGYVDRQRVERRNAYLIHCSLIQSPVSILDYLPLPYDEELKEFSDNGEDMKAFYENAKLAWDTQWEKFEKRK